MAKLAGIGWTVPYLRRRLTDDNAPLAETVGVAHGERFSQAGLELLRGEAEVRRRLDDLQATQGEIEGEAGLGEHLLRSWSEADGKSALEF